MKIEVDHRKCTGHDVGESLAPNEFEINDDDLVLKSKVVSDGMLGDTSQAMDGCLALTLEE
jgi:ferredoxin